MTNKKQQPERATFAEVVREVEQTVAVSDIRTIEYLGAKRSFVDANGVEWRKRGDGLGERQLLRLLRDPTVVVLHEYVGQRTQIGPEDREGFWNAAAERVAESDFAELHGSEFKNAHNHHLLVITELC